MSLHRIIIFSTLFLLYAPSATVVRGQEAGKMSGVPLTVSLDLDRTSVKIDDSIVLTTLVKNVGRQPIFLYGKLEWGLNSSLFLFVTDKNGKAVPITYLDDTLPPIPSPTDKSLFIKLNPEHIFGATRIKKLSDLVPEPGIYYLQVEYHGPVPRRFAAGTPAWGLEDGTLASNKVRIEVR